VQSHAEPKAPGTQNRPQLSPQAPRPQRKNKKFMNPSSQQHTTRITTKKITNLFHSCSMQRRRSEFSQGVFCCFFPPGFCLPHNLPPANRNLFRNRCKSRGIGCKCRIHICPKAKLFSSKRWWLGPTHHACSTCEDLVRAENAHKQTKSRHAHKHRGSLARSINAQSFAWTRGLSLGRSLPRSTCVCLLAGN